jgi:hypothetical protein
MTHPQTQRCAKCGQDWWDAHVCPPEPKKTSWYVGALPLGNQKDGPGVGAYRRTNGRREWSEEEIRALIREELAKRHE